MSLEKLRPLFNVLKIVPQLEMHRKHISVDDLLSEFEEEYNDAQKTSGGNLSLGIIDGVLNTTLSFAFADALFKSPAYSLSKYDSHDGITVGADLVLPLWQSDQTVLLSFGTWDIFNERNQVIAKLVQRPSLSDPIATALLLSYPSKWLKGLDVSGDFEAGFEPIGGYISFKTRRPILIENILSRLASVGLQTYPVINSRAHCLQIGGLYLTDSATGSIHCKVPINWTASQKNQSVLRAKMFRYACIGEDPFEAFFRYYHVIEHMFDDIVFRAVKDLLVKSMRPREFGKKLKGAVTETACAQNVFLLNFKDQDLNDLCLMLNSKGLMGIVDDVCNILSLNKPKFDFITTMDSSSNVIPNKKRKEYLGSFIYQCRNATVHRKETETAFDRLDQSHRDTMERVIPILQFSVIALLLNA